MVLIVLIRLLVAQNILIFNFSRFFVTHCHSPSLLVEPAACVRAGSASTRTGLIFRWGMKEWMNWNWLPVDAAVNKQNFFFVRECITAGSRCWLMWNEAYCCCWKTLLLVWLVCIIASVDACLLYEDATYSSMISSCVCVVEAILRPSFLPTREEARCWWLIYEMHACIVCNRWFSLSYCYYCCLCDVYRQQYNIRQREREEER